MPGIAELELPHLAMEEPAFAADPFPHFDTARAAHPWLASSNFGFVVTQYQAVRELLAMEANMRTPYRRDGRHDGRARHTVGTVPGSAYSRPHRAGAQAAARHPRARLHPAPGQPPPPADARGDRRTARRMGAQRRVRFRGIRLVVPGDGDVQADRRFAGSDPGPARIDGRAGAECQHGPALSPRIAEGDGRARSLRPPVDRRA